VLHSFSGGDGSLPETGLLLDQKGNLYGTTSRDGAGYGGTVFRISQNGKFVTLYSFSGYGDGSGPESDLIADGDGNLYGTTAAGGIDSGVVFKLARDGTESVLYDFGGAPDGWLPLGNLVLDAQGNLYGATLFGGDETPNGCHRAGCGVVWRLTPNGKETVLHAFENRSDGRYPYAGVVLDANGNLWGTAADGGTYRSGTVFRVKP
jgi:uncharacterized repeat protein (TIGR03803 family)